MPKVPLDTVRRSFLGLDPGANGGIALLTQSSAGVEAEAQSLIGLSCQEVWRWIDNHDWMIATTHAVLEKVWARPGQGVTSMFSFGCRYGELSMALAAAQIPYDNPTPQQWQKALQIPPRKKSESQDQFKKRLLKIAQQLYPSLPNWDGKTQDHKLAVADALLIATYCLRKQTGTL